MATWSCVALAGINNPIQNDKAFTGTDPEVYETNSTAVEAHPGAGNTFTLSIDDGKTVTLKSVNPINNTSTVIDARDCWGNHVYKGGHLIVE